MVSTVGLLYIYFFFILTFYVVKTGSSNICLCDFYSESVNTCGILHLILLLLLLLLLRFHVTLLHLAVLMLASGV